MPTFSDYLRELQSGTFDPNKFKDTGDKWDDYDKYLANLIGDPLYSGNRGLGPEFLDQRTNQYFDQARQGLMRSQTSAVSGAGSLASARGYSQGLSNPFALAQRAEQGVYGQYAGMLGDLETNRAGSLSDNLMKSWQTNQMAQQGRQDWAGRVLGYQGSLFGLRSQENQANQDREASAWGSLGQGLGYLSLGLL